MSPFRRHYAVYRDPELLRLHRLCRVEDSAWRYVVRAPHGSPRYRARLSRAHRLTDQRVRLMFDLDDRLAADVATRRTA